MVDRQASMENLIGRILLIGVISSTVLLVIGEGWRWLRTGSFQFEYMLSAHSVAGFIVGEVKQMAHGSVRPRLFINFGLVVLLLTPYARVAASLIYFVTVEKNPKYIFFTSVVLSVLTYSLFTR